MKEAILWIKPAGLYVIYFPLHKMNEGCAESSWAVSCQDGFAAV